MKCYVLQCNQISAIAAVKLKAILRAYAAGGDEETSKSSAAAEFMSFALRPRFHRHTQIHFFFSFYIANLRRLPSLACLSLQLFSISLHEIIESTS